MVFLSMIIISGLVAMVFFHKKIKAYSKIINKTYEKDEKNNKASHFIKRSRFKCSRRTSVSV